MFVFLSCASVRFLLQHATARMSRLCKNFLWWTRCLSPPLLLSILFFLSLVLLGVSIEHGRRLLREPLAPAFQYSDPTIPTLITCLYTTTAPALLTILVPTTQILYLYRPQTAAARERARVCNAVFPILLVLCSAAAASLWTVCEAVDFPASRTANANVLLPRACPQRRLFKPQARLRDGLQSFKLALGWSLVGLFLVYIVIVAVFASLGRTGGGGSGSGSRNSIKPASVGSDQSGKC